MEEFRKVSSWVTQQVNVKFGNIPNIVNIANIPNSNALIFIFRSWATTWQKCSLSLLVATRREGGDNSFYLCEFFLRRIHASKHQSTILKIHLNRFPNFCWTITCLFHVWNTNCLFLPDRPFSRAMDCPLFFFWSKVDLIIASLFRWLQTDSNCSAKLSENMRTKGQDFSGEKGHEGSIWLVVNQWLVYLLLWFMWMHRSTCMLE